MVIVPPEASIYDGVETRFVKTAVGLYVPGFISVKKLLQIRRKLNLFYGVVCISRFDISVT